MLRRLCSNCCFKANGPMWIISLSICHPAQATSQLTLSQKIPVTGSVVVTTPQDIALIDAKKAVDMFQKVNIPIFGVLKICRCTFAADRGHSEAIFGHDGGKHLADKLGVPRYWTAALKPARARSHGVGTVTADARKSRNRPSPKSAPTPAWGAGAGRGR